MSRTNEVSETLRKLESFLLGILGHFIPKIFVQFSEFMQNIIVNIRQNSLFCGRTRT